MERLRSGSIPAEIRRTLEAAGMQFIDAEPGVRPGVRLRDPRHKERKIDEGQNGDDQV